MIASRVETQHYMWCSSDQCLLKIIRTDESDCPFIISEPFGCDIFQTVIPGEWRRLLARLIMVGRLAYLSVGFISQHPCTALASLVALEI